MPTVTTPPAPCTTGRSDLPTPTGPPVVFVHGFLVDSTLWDGVADASRRPRDPLVPRRLAARQPPHADAADADLSPAGVARMINDVLDRARSRRRHARRQRHRRGDLPAAARRRPEPHRAGGADELRRVRELPAEGVRAAVPRRRGTRGSPRCCSRRCGCACAAALAAGLRDAAAPAARRRAHAPAGSTPALTRSAAIRERHRPLRPRASTARPGQRRAAHCATSPARRASCGERPTVASRWPPAAASPRRSPTASWSRSPTCRRSCRSTRRTSSPTRSPPCPRRPRRPDRPGSGRHARGVMERLAFTTATEGRGPSRTAAP